MAKASRSKNKLPEFDPSELDDLIFTPAVGSGVGSHLLQHQADTPTVVTSADTTVAISAKHPVVASDETTVVVNMEQPRFNADIEQNTVTPNIMTTVVKSLLAPEVGTDQTTVVMSVDSSEPPISLWLTEGGEIVPASRVKRIRLAQDVLSPAEESVYDTLWGVKSAFKEERESHRIVQAGYDFLMKRTRLSKKTIQRIVDRLIDKGFIAIEKPADIYLRSSTVYRVFAYRAVLERQAQRRRFHVAKIGPGFVYVREVGDPRIKPLTDAQGNVANLSTVANSTRSTVGGSSRSTGAVSDAVTGVENSPTTVVMETTRKIVQETEGYSSSPLAEPAAPGQGSVAHEASGLRTLLERYLGFIDDDATRQLLRQCRLRAPDCTIEEIAYFVSHKMRSVNGIHNPVGFILTAVPKHFENNGHNSVRAFLKEERERRYRIWQEEYRYWHNIVADPESSPAEREQAEEVIDSLEKAADRPTGIPIN